METRETMETREDDYTDQDEIQRLGSVIHSTLPYYYKRLSEFISLKLMKLSKNLDANINNFYFEAEYEGKKVEIGKVRNKEHCYKLSITEGDNTDIFYYVMPINQMPVYTNITMKGEKLIERKLFKMKSPINPIVEESCWDERSTGKPTDGQFTDKQKELIARLSENVIDSKNFLASIIDYSCQVYNYAKKSDEKQEYIGCHTPFSSETHNRNFWCQYSLEYNREYIDKWGFNGYISISLIVNDSKASIRCYMVTNDHPSYGSIGYEEFIAANPDIDLEPLKQQIKIVKELDFDTSEIPEDLLQSPKEETKYITQKSEDVR